MRLKGEVMKLVKEFVYFKDQKVYGGFLSRRVEVIKYCFRIVFLGEI